MIRAAFTALLAAGLTAATVPETLEARLERASKALQSGDARGAVEHFIAASREAPHTPALHLAAAEALARSGRSGEAVPFLQRAARLGGVGSLKRLEDAFAASLTVAGVTAAIDALKANASPLTGGRVAWTLEEKDLIPENVAWDPEHDVFYVGSLYKRKIVKVGRDGAVSDFVPQAGSGIWAVLGMKVEPRRRELWANACNPMEPTPPMVPDDPETRGRTGVFRFDLRSGRLVGKHVTGSREAPVCFNDLVITPDGGAWLSAGPDGIWRVTPGTESPVRVVEYQGFVNGIAASDDGALIFLADHLRGVQVMQAATREVRALRLPEDVTLSGIDGLYVRGRTLVAVQNGLGSSPNQVAQAELDPSLSQVTCHAVLDRNRPEFDIPTTGVLVKDELFYVASSQLRAFDGGVIWPPERLTKSTILRTPLAGPGCRTAKG
ncbi:MAG: tetratricopeptide repeat protein [Candidatus Polarisedimenticolia bacterium]